MANNKSAKKRVKINKKQCLQNKYYKTSTKTLLKLFYTNLYSYQASKSLNDKEKLKETLNLIYSFIDKGTKKKIFHKNTSARKKAKLVASLKSKSVIL